MTTVLPPPVGGPETKSGSPICVCPERDGISAVPLVGASSPTWVRGAAPSTERRGPAPIVSSS
ncbi:hypothetical protein BE08_01035 [Sorangium cellulosum]|uniref:Uncharacterized protein n=1 Tax=Sorangium cellulosum TaxID=56 RepID=A0A150PET5_SORCE|nr:hypothetical protein BE08_01035 [Sorangium cellulosum]